MTEPSATRVARRLLYATNGLTTHDRRFVEAAVDAGWQVYYARFDGTAQSLDARQLPAEVVPCDWLGAHEAFAEHRRSAFAAAFARLEAEVRPDLVHAGPVPTVGEVAVSSAAAPVIVMSWASDLLVDVQHQPAARAAAAKALRECAGVIVDCEAVAHAATALGARAERTLVVPWGVDLDAFAFHQARTPRGALRLLSLRTFEPVYDVATLLRAVATVRDTLGDSAVHLTLAGSGSLEGELRGLASTLGIESSLRWIGRIAETDVAHYLADTDLHVSTSLSDGSSISLLQAMAVGRPSIVTDIPSNREWVTPDANGWLFHASDPDDLARIIGHALKAKTTFSTMARACRTTAESRADWCRNRRRIADFYERIAL